MTKNRKRKHHDSAIQLQGRARARRKSVGVNWRKLPMKLLFWPDELERLVRPRPRPCRVPVDDDRRPGES